MSPSGTSEPCLLIGPHSKADRAHPWYQYGYPGTGSGGATLRLTCRSVLSLMRSHAVANSCHSPLVERCTNPLVASPCAGDFATSMS